MTGSDRAWLIGLLLAAALAGDAESAVSGRVEGTVKIEPAPRVPVGAHYRERTRGPILEPDPPRAIVYLERDDGRYPPLRDDEVRVISQEGYQFRPGIAAVQVGARVRFPNRDDEFHSVFSYSAVKRFDLGRYRKGEETPPVTFERPGVVRVYCEIHKHMRNLLLVLETPWFTASDAGGAFELPNVPPGKYTLRAFLPTEETLEAPVSVEAGQVARVRLGTQP